MAGHVHWSNMSDAHAASDSADLPSQSLERLHGALAELLRAYDYASDVRRGVWDFAVEASLLRRIGLTVSDFRWMICKGYMQHAQDVTGSDSQTRRFVPDAELSFSRRTCFVLTEEGVAFARRRLHGAQCNGESVMPRSDASSMRARPKPNWDPELHELTMGCVLVKRFKWPALNQETLLAAFQEEGWPTRIDDPLPPQPEQDSKRRLHDTIKSLNRNQYCPLLRFKGDGTGEGARWEPLSQPEVGFHFHPMSP